ncbi:MAG TPA: CBM35 domain-containing protein, partial [Polyangia bacterium]
TGGSGAPGSGGDGAPAGSGGGTPDAAAGTGGGGAGAGTGGGGSPDAAPDAPMEPGIIIQEDQPGFSAVDGKIYPRQGSTSITGFTGTGFADGDPGMGKTIAWSVKAETAGTYRLVWRYAFGGAAANTRDAKLAINGVTVADMVTFAYTTDWTNWQQTPALEVQLAAGSNFIQLAALGASGLANIDYLQVLGEGLTPDNPSFSLTVAPNDAAAGSVSWAPMQAFYPAGASVMLTATPNAGYFFQSWTGDSPSATAATTITMTRNMVMTARFLPDGTVQDPALLGYAAVQDDAGTPYLLNGGSLGPTVTATTVDELKMYLGSPGPYVVQVSGLMQGTDSIDIKSDKTLLGVGADAHLQGLELSMNGSRNIIIRNIAVSHVIADGAGVANDAIVMTGAMNVWIDHCELYSDLTHGKDYYDGLVEIKNGASFVTVSRCHIHDHYKVSLISSGDEQVGDTVIRATYHHNYFHDVGSRLPSIRFGKAHVFNNYYINVPDGSGVNSRMGAVVRVEGNYFQGVENPIVFLDSAKTGYWDVTGGNTFVGCTGSQPTTSTGQLTPPYSYTLDAVTDVPAAVPAAAGVGKL